jgi:cellobiose dehydrogenase (acceptor)
VLNRTNFHLQLNTRVLRVERSGKRATGVTILLPNNQNATIALRSTSSRVILSGGALFTPALLMYSGIGPLADLERLRTANRLAPYINSTKAYIVNNSTGVGLFDNPNTFIELSGPSIQSFTYTYNISDPLASQYLTQKSGPYTFAGQTTVFWDTVTRPNGTVAAFQGTIGTSGFGEYTNSSTITLNIYGTSGLKSSGKVVLDSKFVPGPSGSVLYSDPQDAKDIAAFIYKIFQGLPGSGAGLSPLNIAQSSTAAQIEKYITSYTQYTRGYVNHWSSSCRIGKCVDKDLKVIGMDGLYVMDSSVLEPLTTNPMFGTMAAAEKGIEGVLRGLKRWTDA